MRTVMVAGDNHFLNERYRVALNEILIETEKYKGLAKEDIGEGEKAKKYDKLRAYIEGRIRLALNK